MTNDTQQLMLVAQSAYAGGEFAVAEERCREVLGVEHDHAGATLLLGVMAARTGRPELAIELLRKVLEMVPNSYVALNWLAGLLRSTGDLAEAISLGERATQLRPRDPESHISLGICHLSSGRPEQAQPCFERAITLNPRFAVAHHNLGIALERQARPSEAIAEYRQAIELAPNVPNAYVNLGQLLLYQGERAEADSCFRGAFEAVSHSPKALVQLALALIEDGFLHPAEQCLRTASELEPDADYPQALLGSVLQRLGRFDEAVRCLERAISLEPRRARTYFDLTHCHKTVPSDKVLIETMSAMVIEGERSPDERRDLHYALGKSFDDLEEYEKAMRHYDLANEIVRQHSNPFDRQSLSENVDLAIRTFTKGFFARHQDLGDESDLPLFLVGMIRSGTSLVEQILAGHLLTGTAGEQMFWIERGTQAIDPVEGPDSAKIAELAAAYLRLLQGFAPDKPHVIDRMPNNFLLLGFIHLVFPNARIIHCRRNPVDDCLAIYFTPSEGVAKYAHDKENIVFFYQEYVRLMKHWRRVLPSDRFLEVDYEELVRDSERVTQQMMEFCGLDAQELGRNEMGGVWKEHHPIYNSSVGRWRKYEPWLGAFKTLLPKQTTR